MPNHTKALLKPHFCLLLRIPDRQCFGKKHRGKGEYYVLVFFLTIRSLNLNLCLLWNNNTVMIIYMLCGITPEIQINAYGNESPMPWCDIQSSKDGAFSNVLLTLEQCFKSSVAFCSRTMIDSHYRITCLFSSLLDLDDDVPVQ